MKRLATLAGLAFAALLGSFAMSAPAHAAVTCTTPTTSGTNTYPMNYLWICNGTGTVTAGDINAVNGSLGHLGNVNVGVVSDAKTKMASNKHYIYVFANSTDYNAYCTGTGDGNNTANPPIPGCHTILSSEGGVTVIDNVTGIDQSIIIENQVSGNITMAETAAHEAGHQLDSIYGIAKNGSGLISGQGNTPAITNEFAFKLTGASAVVQGGPITVGDTLTITFKGTLLSSTPVTYTITAGDTTTSLIATHFATQINGVSALTSSPINVNATASGATIQITSGAILSYSVSATGNRESLALSNYDWPAFDALTPCSINTAVFNAHQDHNGVYICSSLAQGTVGGTIHTGDIMGISVTDGAVSPNPRSVSYTVQAGDTTTKIAAGLALAINNDTGTGSLHAAGITATSSGAVLSISSGTNNSTYAYSPGMGVTETLTGLSTVTAGNGATLSNTYSSYTTNDKVLQVAWPYYFTNSGSVLWAELFAEETSKAAGGNSVPGGQTQDNYLGSGNFICSKFLVQTLENSGNMPTQAQFSSACK